MNVKKRLIEYWVFVFECFKTVFGNIMNKWLSLMNIHSPTPKLDHDESTTLLPALLIFNHRSYLCQEEKVRDKHERGQTRTIPIPTLTVFTALLCIFVESYEFLL